MMSTCGPAADDGCFVYHLADGCVHHVHHFADGCVHHGYDLADGCVHPELAALPLCLLFI